MTTQQRFHVFCAWCGIGYCILVFVGWWLVGGYFPVHAPSAGAEEIAAFYRREPNWIRAGLVIVMLASALFIPFVAALIESVQKIEGRVGPLTTVTGMAGFVNAIGTFYPPLIWLTAAFRPEERAPDLTYLVNDMAWIFFIGGLLLYVPIYVSVAVATWLDSEERVFPRWYAYYTGFTGLAVLPDQMLFFFKSGPFAWNGLISFWIPITIFVLWFLVTFWLIRRSVLADVRTTSAKRALA